MYHYPNKFEFNGYKLNSKGNPSAEKGDYSVAQFSTMPEEKTKTAIDQIHREHNSPNMWISIRKRPVLPLQPVCGLVCVELTEAS